MALNIKNLRACLLIEELAKTTGETMTGAIVIAVEERLKRLRQQQPASLADRLLAIGQDCAKRLGPEYRTLDHDQLLYDEKGMPIGH